MKPTFKCFALIILLIALSCSAFALKPDTGWTEKTAKKWVRSKVWSHGSSFKVHSSVNNVAFARQYQVNKIYWDKAFAFLNDKKLADMAPGKYPIDGDHVYATITQGPSKEFDQSAWESHRNYIDLQYVIKGKEKIGIAPIGTAIVVKPYDETKDSANYTADGKYYIASPGTFFLFFPGDVHRPNIKVEGYDSVKKLVIKIKVAK